MTRVPSSITARLRAKARLESETARVSFVVTPALKLAWLGSATFRAPAPGHIDVVSLGRRDRG